MDILSILLIDITLYVSFVLGRNCRTNSFHQHTQENFDPVKFQGRWYAMSTNNYWIRSYFVPQNVQLEFNALQDGRISVQASGSFFGSFCDYVAGSGKIVNKEKPAVFDVSFETNYSLAKKVNTYWVLSTDYESYAVVFTCWNTLEDGTCDPEESYIWTFTRSLSGHSLSDLAAINDAVPFVCMSPRDFKTFQQDGGCDFNPFNFPNTYGMVFIMSTVFIGFIIFLVFFIYCLTKVSNGGEGPQRKGNVIIFN
ncbi:retinol-binding protein 4-like [Mytilus galloprovincialis]|uniref:retinol-binding protein 4-like n=1 Tax=Mytilus galloprovincialis TaxID=29158 RepID=UPI003F7CC389